MNVTAAFLAEEISINDGVVDVRRGWPEWWNIHTIPGTTEVLVGVVLEFEQYEMGTQFDFDASFRQGGREIARGGFGYTPSRVGEFVAGTPFHHALWFKMSGIPISEVGPCEIELQYRGEPLATIRFVIRLKP